MGPLGQKTKHLKHSLSRPMNKLKVEMWKARVQVSECASARDASYKGEIFGPEGITYDNYPYQQGIEECLEK